MAKAVCTTCGKEYGNFGGHKWGEWDTSNGRHIRTCTLDTTHTESGNCNYSAATCLAASACSVCGHVYEAQKSHSYTYTADGNTITESCINDCGHSAKATLTASNQTYTGSAITTGASISYGTGWAGNKPQPAASNYSNNTNAGTATVTTTVEGKALTASFTIAPKELTSDMVTLSPESGTYTGSVIAQPTVTVQDGTAMTASDYTVTWPNDADWTNTGTITVTVTGKNNYTGTVTKDFTIGKGTPTKELFQFQLPQNAIYDGATA